MKRMTQMLLGLATIATLGMSAQAASENFDTFTAGTSVGQSANWSNLAGQPLINASGGVNGSRGIDTSGVVFHWNAQAFSWAALNSGDKVVVGMDFQASSANLFDDDRIGWTTTNTSTGSQYQFGMQLDNRDSNALGGMVGYWRDTYGTGTTLYTSMGSTLTTSNVVANAWYRAQVQFTKGTNTCLIDSSATLLDASGNPTSTIFTGTTSVATDGVLAGYFTAASLSPTFKNHSGNSVGGSVDNAYFLVVAVPEPASLSVLMLGGLLLGRRRSV